MLHWCLHFLVPFLLHSPFCPLPPADPSFQPRAKVSAHVHPCHPAELRGKTAQKKEKEKRRERVGGSYLGKLNKTQKAQSAATEKGRASHRITVKLYLAFLRGISDRCVQYPVSHFIWIPSHLLARDFDSCKHEQMRTLWCLMVFFTQPQESEAGQTFENRHQKQEAIPQLLS